MATILGGISKGVDCKQSGGIKEMYIMSHGEASYSPVVTNGILTALSDGITPVNLYKIEVDPAQSSATEDIQTDVELGTQGVQQNISLITLGITDNKLQTVQSYMIQCVLLIHYNSGTTSVFGLDNFLDPDNMNVTRGTAFIDAHKIDISYIGEEFELAPTVSGSTAISPLGNLVQGTDYTLIT